MKTTIFKLIFLIFSWFFVYNLYAQDPTNDKPSSNINTVARYKDNGVELRFFPDNKRVLYSGIKNGFVIERAEIAVSSTETLAKNKLSYKKIGETKPFNEQQWQDLLSKSNNEENSHVELAYDFFKLMNEKNGAKLNFEKGIKNLAEQKSKEDFEFLIVILNVVQCKVCANALGIAYIDKTVQANKKYVYRAKINNEIENYIVISKPFTIETNHEKTDPNRTIKVTPGDGELTFQWEISDLISGVVAERKNPFTGQWELLDSVPQFTLNESKKNSYFDTKLTNYKTYEYRFYGNNPFGERVLFGTAKGMPIDLTPPKPPMLLSAKQTKPDEVAIEWTVKTPIDSDLKGFWVARGESNKGNFEILHDKILSIEKRKFVDTTFKRNKPNYYLIQAVDTSGNVSATIPAFVTLIDSIPPVKPKFLSGKIDSLGVVSLEIEKNKEADLMGYRLFRANSAEHEFSVIREGFNPNDTIEKPVQLIFTDTVTLNSLTPYIYYRAVALDKNFNQSEFSDILKIVRLDTVPPTTPVFKSIVADKKEINLKFVLSKSEDVKEHYIYRKTDVNANWEILSKLENNQKVYIDKDVKKNVTYYYSLRAKDTNNLYSNYAVAVYGNIYDDGVRPPVENLTIQKIDNKMVLTWNYKNKDDDTFFVIYKSKSKGSLNQYKNTENLTFEEKFDNNSSYAVKVFTKDGGQSVMSKTVSLNK